MHTKNKKTKHINRKIKILVFIVFSFFVALSFTPKAWAVLSPPVKSVDGVEVNTGEQTQIELQKAKEAEEKKAKDSIFAVAFKNGVRYFLRTIAIDLATYIASGGEGQQPLFYTEGWGAYLKREGDLAAGTFINSFAQGLELGNICSLNFDLKLGITLGLIAAKKPTPPSCSFSELLKNWETSLSDPNKFLRGIDAYFNPNENDLAVGLEVHSSFLRKITDKINEKTNNRKEGDGIKPLTDEITGFIKTPGTLIAEKIGVDMKDQNADALTFTGQVAADTLNAFTSTLASKFLERFFQKGLALQSSFGKEERFNWDNIEAITSPNASPNRGGRDDARREFSSFISPSFGLGNPAANRIDVTAELLNEGIIGIQFKTAIDRKFTISKAIEDGLLLTEGAGSTFGFTSSNNQPDPHEGYSYNAMVILRKYRVLPVGWELAASYIKENFQNRIYSLGDIIRDYNNASSPFYRLIDTSWVLKAPDTFCRLEGPGDELILDDWRTEKRNDTTQEPPQEYTFNQHNISRKDYCADSKSCIYEDGNGNCIYYGYCTEEKSLWRFNGETCPAYYNTCQKFADEDNKTSAFLASTLDSKDCSVDSVGCQWYCTEYNAFNNIWTCLDDGEKTLKPCDDSNGCAVVDAKTGETCTIPYKNVSCTVSACSAQLNVLTNGSFEKASAITVGLPDAWALQSGVLDDISRVNGVGQKVNAGSFSMRLSYFGGPLQQIIARSEPITIDTIGVAKTYTLQGKIYNNLTYGKAYIAILDPVTFVPVGEPEGCATNSEMAKGSWISVNCTFTITSNAPAVPNVAVGLFIEDLNNYPVGTAWFDDIRVQPACPDKDVVIYLNANDSLDESKLYLDRDVKECDVKDSGCHEFIRTKPALGTNIIFNGGFEDWNDQPTPSGWTSALSANIEKISENATQGKNYLRFNQSTSVHSQKTNLLSAGKRYIVSLSAKKESAVNTNLLFNFWYTNNGGANTQLLLDLGLGLGASLDLKDEWSRFISKPFIMPVGKDYYIEIDQGNNEISSVDAVMIEEVGEGSVIAQAYSEYGEKNSVFLKQPPAYLNCTGDPEKDHTSCSNFALLCSKDEVGCEMYRPTNNDPSVPGVVTEFDRCPKECSGYQTFKQTATNFEEEKFPIFFIPKTGKQCAAKDAGCDEFTNLDTVSKGGEGREYFKYLRQCQKPNDSCQTFYTWVGSDTAGFQLKVYSLKDGFNNQTGIAGKDDIPDIIPNPRKDLGRCVEFKNPPLAPATEATCKAADPSNMWMYDTCYDGEVELVASAKNAQTNPNCREFYSTSIGAGDPQYVIVQNTIACTDQCFPYRLSNTIKTDCEFSGGVFGICGKDAVAPFDGTIDTQLTLAECAANKGFTFLGSSECYTRQSDCTDVWNTKNQCVYQAVPSEGVKCSAQSASCREYKGNTSGNVRVVFTDNLEEGNTVSWSLGAISNEALAVGGHSIQSELFGPHLARTFSITGSNGVCQELSGGVGYTACTSAIRTNCFDKASNICIFANASQQCVAQAGNTRCGLLDGKIIAGSSYVISFWAKSAQTQLGDVDIELNGIPTSKQIATVQVGQNWQEYTVGPFDVGPNDVAAGMWLDLVSPPTRPMYYDFITIKQVRQYNYVIKNSWKTPESCDTNPYIDPTQFPPPNAPQYMIGCRDYQSASGKTEYLKSFTKLCRESAVGCEMLIDTHNTASPFAQTFNSEYPISRIDAPEDEIVYIVNDPKKTCGVNAVGCEAVGEPIFSGVDGSLVGYNEKYFLNDPEQYQSILCNENALDCKQYVSEKEGVVYFKDPKSRTCEYKQVTGTSSYGWFRAGSTSSFPDCPLENNNLSVAQPGKSCAGGDTPGKTCVSDTECQNGRCAQWIGECREEASGCSAYIDPQSIVNNNTIANGNFESFYKVCASSKSPCNTKDQCPIGEECGPETRLYRWAASDQNKITHVIAGGYTSSSGVVFAGGIDAGGSAIVVSIAQGKTLEKGVLYTVFARSKNTSDDVKVTIEASQPNSFSQFDNSLQLNLQKSIATLPVKNISPDEFAIFAGRFFVENQDTTVTIKVSGNRGVFDDIELKKTGVYYNLSKDVDKRSCNGIVNAENGCVLFNDMSQSLLTFSSLETKKDSTPILCKESGCDSNTIIKVSPDRDCAKWLECVSGREQTNFKTGKKENFCQNIAECTSLNPANGQCNNFPQVNKTVQEYDPGSADLIKNISGYAKVGYKWDENSSIPGYYPYAAMEQKKECVRPLEKTGEECIENEDCNSSALANDGVCQPILKVRDDKNLYEQCRLYPEGGSPRWGDKGPSDTGDKPAGSVVTDLNNPLGQKFWIDAGIDSKNQKILSDAAECSYYKDENIFQGMYGFCIEKDPRSPYLCLNWLPVDELTGGVLGTGWSDNIRDNMFYCAAGSTLEYREEHTEKDCMYGELWQIILADITPVGAAINYGVAYGTDACGGMVCPYGYIPSIKSSGCGDFLDPGTQCAWTCTPDPKDYKFTDSDGKKWYDYREKKDKNENFIKKHIMYCPDCDKGKVFYDPEDPDEKQKEPAGWRRICDAVVKVSGDDGANRGWKRRLESILEFKESGYRAPDYGYVVDTINNPFGSIGKRWRGDPQAWPYLIDTVDATKFEKPYFDIFGGGENVGQIYHDIFSSVDPVPFATNPQGGFERIKRLFAQSFGTWQWNGTNYTRVQPTESRCVGGSNDGDICNKADPASCKDTTSTCLVGGGTGFCAYFNPAKSLFVRDEALSCNDNPNAISTTCQGANYVFCATGKCGTAGNPPENWSQRPCTADAQCTTTGEKCLKPSGGYGHCTGDLTKKCTDDAVCQNANPSLGACVKNNPTTDGYCSSGSNDGDACANNAGCKADGAICMGICSGSSAIQTNECYSTPGDPAKTADAFCRKDGVCVDFNYWQPPALLCRGNIRPNYFLEEPLNPLIPPTPNPADPLAPGDWCGISPEVRNVSIQNATGPTYSIGGGSGEITLNFNVDIDDNQLPLKRLEINWGDSQPSNVIAPATGLRDKPDATDPFSFTHVYFYDKAYDAGCQTTPSDCNGWNDYKIHILVKDNWGWCTCKDFGNCKFAGPDNECPNQRPADLDTSNSWILVNTTIHVSED